MAGVIRTREPTLAAWAWPNRGDVGADKAAFVAREHVLGLISAALGHLRREALLVKGVGLSQLYPSPWLRPMSDIDLLFRKGDLERAIAALRSAGFAFDRDPNRARTDAVLEIAARPPPGAPQLLVELHISLDKVVLRQLDVDAVFARSRAHPTLTGLRVPSLEDHMLLTIQHLAADEFQHATGFVDLEVLLGAGADIDLVVRQAREAGAAVATYVALSTLANLRPTLVPAATLVELRPPGAHERLLRSTFEIGGWPVAKRPTQLGPRWFFGQLLLSDDRLRYLVGLARFAAARGAERLEQRFGRR